MSDKEEAKEQEKEATPPPPEKKEEAAKTDEAAPAEAGKKPKGKKARGMKGASAMDKYFAAAILFSIFVVIVSGFGAGVSFYEVFYRCIIISMVLWVVSIVVKKYCSLLTSFKGILDEMKRDSAVSSYDE